MEELLESLELEKSSYHMGLSRVRAASEFEKCFSSPTLRSAYCGLRPLLVQVEGLWGVREAVPGGRFKPNIWNKCSLVELGAFCVICMKGFVHVHMRTCTHSITAGDEL